MGIISGKIIGASKGDTRSLECLDYSSYEGLLSRGWP